MNGIIKDIQYRRIMSAYDELLITLVAIESLGTSNIEPLPKIGGHATIGKGEKTASAIANPKKEANPSLKVPITIDPAVAESIQEIVRNYYCFQIGIKQKYDYKYKGVISAEVIDSLCADNPPK